MIIRRRHTANFTTIANVLFEDERLALDELGLMSWLRSRPDNWEVRRPALMRRFKVGRDGLRRIMRSLLRYGWIRAQITRLSNGTVHVLYEVRDEPGPELSEEEARAALSLVSSGAGAGGAADDDGEGDIPDGPDTGDPPAGGAQPPTGQPGAASRLRLSPPGPIEDSLKTDSVKTESPKGVRAFADVRSAWPPDHVLSAVAAEAAFVGLIETKREFCHRGVKPYLADCRANNRKICDLTTYIREERWERFVSGLARQSSSGTPTATRPGTPQWYRWRDHNRAHDPAAMRLMESWAGQGRPWYAPTEWPPPSAAEAKPTPSPAEAEPHDEMQIT